MRRINKKGQGEFHLARYPNRLRIDAPLPKDNKFTSLFKYIVKSRKQRRNFFKFFTRSYVSSRGGVVSTTTKRSFLKDCFAKNARNDTNMK